MQLYSKTHRVPVDVNADLIDWVDQLVHDSLKDSGTEVSQDAIEQSRIQAIENAIQHWCKQQTDHRLQRFADLHRQRHDNDETGWLV